MPTLASGLPTTASSKLNKIIIEGDTNLIDGGAREWLKSFETKFDTLNERTKRQTKDIQELKRKIKELKNE